MFLWRIRASLSPTTSLHLGQTRRPFLRLKMETENNIFPHVESENFTKSHYNGVWLYKLTWLHGLAVHPSLYNQVSRLEWI